jgi:hypothetical protein
MGGGGQRSTGRGAKDRQAGAKGGSEIDFLYCVQFLVVTGVELLFTSPHIITMLGSKLFGARYLNQRN